MAPATRATKRGAQPQNTKAAKKPKSDHTLEAVTTTIEGASDLTESCCKMLLAALPCSLSIPSDLRSSEQTRFVNMIGEVFDDVKASKQNAVESAEAAVNEVSNSKSGLDAKMSDAEGAVSAAKNEADAKKALLAEAARVADAARVALSEAQKVRDDGEASLKKAREEKDSIEKVIAVELKELNGSVELELGTVKTHTEVILKLSRRAGLDDSLLTSIPSALEKAPANRGEFDLMVMTQLEKSLNDKVEELSSKLASEEEAAAAHSPKVAAAESASDDSLSAKLAATNELQSAKDSVTEAEAAMKSAKKAVVEFEPTLKAAVDACSQRKEELESFLNYNLNCFETLRDKVSKAVETEAVDPEVAAEAGA